MFDAIIIGGGLAGSSAGISLARKGWRVLIVEKQRRSEKVCGEFLSPSVWPVLRELGMAEKILSLGGNAVRTVCFSSAAGSKAETALPAKDRDFAFGYGVSRQALDACLLAEAKAAGCEVLCPAEALKVETHENFHRVILREGAQAARVVINAGGRSFRHRSLAKAIGNDRGKIGFKAHFEGPSAGDRIRLFFFPGGYFGVVEVEKNQINLCGIADKKCIKKFRANFDFFLDEIAKQNPLFGGWYQTARRKTGWLTCASLVHGRNSSSADGVFSSGDSACFLEPFMGQGMTMALASGLLLAETLGSAPPSRKEFPALQAEYQWKLDRLYRSRLSIGKIFQRLAMSGAQSSLLIRLLASFPPLFRFGIKKSSELTYAF